MKFEDALKQIEGAESVGGQLIVNRGGKNVLVGKNVQGTLIVENDEEAKGIAREFDDDAVEDGEEAEAEDQSRSPLSTDPIRAATHEADPVPYTKEATKPSPGNFDATQDRRDALEQPDGSDRDTPHPNTGRAHEQRVDDKVEVKDKASKK